MIHNGNYGERSDAEGHIGQGLTINRDSETRDLGIIDSTVRTMQRVKSGKMTPEDLDYCLEVNAKSMGVSVENLKQEATAQLERVEAEVSSNDETINESGTESKTQI